MLKSRQRSRFYGAVFVASLGVSLYSYFIPVFAQSFGATFLDLGVIGTVGALATAIVPMLAGHVADRMNRAWVFSLSLIINVFATFILIFSRSVYDIVILRLIGGIGMGTYWPTAEALVADLSPISERVREMGRYSIASALGILIGPLIGGLVIEGFGYAALFLTSSAVIGVSLVQVLVWIVPGYGKGQTPGLQSSSSNMRTIRRLVPWYMMLLCYGVVWGLITSIFPGYANSVGISAAVIGLLFSAFGVTRILSLATAHRILKYGERRTLIIISLMISAGIFTLAFLPSFITFLVGMLILGGCVGVAFPITINLISRHFPDESAGAAMGSYETSVNTGETVGPYLAGALASATNIESSFLMMSIFGVLMAAFAANGGKYSDIKSQV